MKIQDIQKQAAATSERSGFHNGERLFVYDSMQEKDLDSVIKALLLIHSEVSEATELTRQQDFSVNTVVLASIPPKPTGFASELADIVIRTCELAERCGIDLGWVIQEKLAYNKERPRKHGKVY